MKQTYAIEGMHCEACTKKIAEALRRVPEVTRAEVSLSPPRARIEVDNHLSVSALQAAVAAAGDYQLREEPQPLEAAGIKSAAETGPQESLYPLVLIVSYIAGAVLIIELASGNHSLHRGMRNFMAGFFLVFSFFKLLDLRGFADAYRTYDILAQAVPTWAWLYPFAELALGIAYLVGRGLVLTNILTCVLMLFGAIGVVRALRQKRAIRCACLGTVLDLPMTTVTLVEDLGMAAMAGAMLMLDR